MLFVASENSILEAEIRTLQRKLMRRDSEIRRRGIEVHKLRVRFSSYVKTFCSFQSVLQEANTIEGENTLNEHCQVRAYFIYSASNMYLRMTSSAFQRSLEFQVKVKQEEK